MISKIHIFFLQLLCTVLFSANDCGNVSTAPDFVFVKDMGLEFESICVRFMVRLRLVHVLSKEIG